MSTPSWSPAITGAPASAGQVDQFLGTHGISYIYQGASIGGITSATATQNVNPTTPFVDQKFTMSGTVIQRFLLRCGITGSGAPLVVGLYTDNAGNPNTLLASVSLPTEWVGANSLISWPLQMTGLTNGSILHWAFSSPAATSGNFPVLTTGASAGFVARTATVFPGGTWTPLATSVDISWYNAAVTGRIVNTWEDSGLRVTGVNFTAAGVVAQVYEWTSGATPLQSFRQVAATSGVLTGVT